MDLLTLDRLREMAAACEGVRVTITLPTHPAAPDNRKDPLQLRALLREAEADLVQQGLRVSEAATMLAPARELADDGLFWRPRPGGVAVFLCTDDMRAYRTLAPLAPTVHVGDRFRVLPLLEAVDRGERFLLLALSQHSVRLFRGDRSGLTEVDLGDMPQDVLEALRVDGFEEQLQLHSSTGGHAPGGGRGPAIFHGSGPDTGITTRYLTEFVKRIAAGLRDLVKDREVPLVLAAVGELAALYREADREHKVIHETVSGNPEGVPMAELHAQAWRIASDTYASDRLSALDRVRELQGTGRMTDAPADVVSAAAYGQVDTLVVAPGASLWGRFDESTGHVALSAERAPGDDDLLELAASRTLQNGGTVLVSGEAAPCAAALRY